MKGRPRPAGADWLALALLAAGLLAVFTGVLPSAEARSVVGRLLPLLAFLATVIVLAELVHSAEVFDVAAAWLARRARGRPALLFALCVALASMTTVVLNLDTTAVLLTPVLLALARQVQLPVLPFAFTAVWLANTASLLLPSSNLTNVLAAGRISQPPLRFALTMAGPALAAIAVTAGLLWLCFWRPALATMAGNRYPVPVQHRPGDPQLALVAALGCVLFTGMVLAGLPLAVASGAAAAVLTAIFAVRRPEDLQLNLLPWRLLVLVPGVLLVVQAASQHGLGSMVASVAGSPGSDWFTVRLAATGAVLSNLVNNLPAYLAGEAVLPPTAHQPGLFGLLIGVNAGPVVTPWASLATLIWLERCRASGVAVPVARFMLTGLLLAALAVSGCVAVLILGSS